MPGFPTLHRRQYLTLVGSAAVGGLGGCLSATDGPAEDPRTTTGATEEDDRESTTRTDSGFDVDTPASGECDAIDPPRPSPPEAFPDPESYPARPDELDRSSVRSFVEGYESTYRYNSLLAGLVAERDCVKYFDTYASEGTVTASEAGYRVTVSTRGSYTGVPCSTRTGTTTQTSAPYVDLAPESATYYVTERFVVREGRTVECW